MAQLVTAEELARLLRISPATVRKWSRTRQIPTIWLSRNCRRFDADEVVHFLRSAAGEEAPLK